MGSSKKPVTGYKFLAGIHMILCHGQIDAIKKIKVDDDKTLMSGHFTAGSHEVNKENLFGGESSQGGISGIIDVMDGSQDQEPNAYISEVLEREKAGSSKYLPAYRGVAGLVLYAQELHTYWKNGNFSKSWKELDKFGMYLGMNPYLKTWKTLVQRIHKTSDGQQQWYDEKAAIQNTNYFFGPKSTFWSYKTVSPSDTTDYLNVSKSTWSQGASPFGDKVFLHPGNFGFPTMPSTLIEQQQVLWAETMIKIDNLEQDFTFECYLDNGIELWINGTHVLTHYEKYSGYFKTDIHESYFSNGENRITLKCIDDGSGVRPDNWIWFDLRLSGSLTTYYDMNPAHIIRECLTDGFWGMGKAESELDEQSFICAADTLYAENLGMSLSWTQESSIESFIDEVRNHINAVIYEDPRTGLTVLKLIRDDYDESALVTLDESCISEVTEFQRSMFSELMNQITVTYTNVATGEDGTITVQDTALVAMQNDVKSKSIQYKGFSNIENAGRIAMRDLKVAATPLISAEITVMRSKARNFRQGDVFKWNWKGYKVDGVIMRVLAVDLGNGKSNTVTLTCTQDIFAMPNSTIATVQPNTPQNNEIQPITQQISFDVPYLELVQRQGQRAIDDLLQHNPDASFLGVACGRPDGAPVQNAQLYIQSENTGNYLRDSSVDFCPVFTVANDLGLLDTQIRASSYRDLGLLDPAEDLPVWAQLNDEIVSITQLEFDDATKEIVLTIKRGALDTIPNKHAKDSTLYVWDVLNGGSETEHVMTEQVSAKLLTSSLSALLDEKNAIAFSTTMHARAIRPYPPANIKINGEYYPDEIGDKINLTWSHRNRVQQTGSDYLGWFDRNVSLEPNVTYHLTITDENSNILFDDDIGAVNQYVFDVSTSQANMFNISLKSVRDGYDSYQMFEHQVKPSFSAPYNLKAEYTE